MTDVFISYSRHDRDHAAQLAHALERQGFSVWWDRELVSGDEFAKEIDRALREAAVAIVIWSRDSVESRWVLDEADLAVGMKKLLPVRWDPAVSIPIGFGQFHADDLAGWDGRDDAPVMNDICNRIQAIKDERWMEAVRNIGGRVFQGEVGRSEALAFLQSLRTSVTGVGGLPWSRLLVGGAGMAGVITAVAAVSAAPVEGLSAAWSILQAFPAVWLALLIIRGVYQFVIVSKGSPSRRFFDRDFSFWVLLSGVLAVTFASLLMIASGGSVFSLVFIAVVMWVALIAVFGVVRLAVTFFTLVVSRL